MSITVPDVNTAFAAERTAQIEAARRAQAAFDARVAAGKLTPLGGGRFRVTDPGSWDNGEILVQANGMILPEHGLDMSTGQAALYSAVPAWHQLGNVIPGGTADIDTVLRLGGINFSVDLRPILYQANPDAPTRMHEDEYLTVRTDTGASLRAVGRRYEVFQNRAVFAFLQDLVDRYDVVWESAGALRGGRRVFVSLRLPDTVTIDADGINDQIVPFIVAINSHDGSSLYQVVATPWRPVCGNTERFALRDAHTRWGVSHTRNALDRVAEARRTLGLSVKYFEAFAAEEEALARTAIAIDEFRAVVDELWQPPDSDASTRTKNNHTKRTDTLMAAFSRNTAALGATAYAAERTITEHLDWTKTIRPPKSLADNHQAFRATLAMEGAEDDVKSRAHKRLLTLVRR